jgi:gluconolactonase
MRRSHMSGHGLLLILLVAAAPAQAQEELPPGARILVEGYNFPEGPAIDREGNLFFSDVWGHTIYKWDGTTAAPFATETTGGNGLAFDADGNLYACAGSGHALLKFTPDGQRSTVLSEIGGLPLNQPNDLVIDAKGNLYFTNPAGFTGSREGHTPVSVGLLRPDGSASVVSAGQIAYPNGIALSPDGKTLYVNDFLGGSVVFEYPVKADATLGTGSALVRFGSGGPDGLAVAASGNLYVALNLGAKIAKVSPEGEKMGEIVFPKGSGVTNLCFGGPDMKTLYVTMARNGRVVALEMDEPGLPLHGNR